MDIQIGKYYVNKTWKYLRPCLRVYGEIFKTKINSLYKLGFGIHDSLLDGTPYADQNLIYILFNRKYKPRNFISFLAWVRNQEYYVLDYAADNVLDSTQHMIVLKIPLEYERAIDKFRQSKYSEMYTPQQISQLFEDGDVIDVLLTRKPARISFAKKLNNTFKTQVTPDDLFGKELDFPIEKQKEYFNYRGS